MLVDGRPMRSVWCEPDGNVRVIDQTQLPHRFEVVTLRTLEDAARAISSMQVRGAPLIGATAAYGVALAMRADTSDAALERAIEVLGATRPTAVNLRWALDAMGAALRPLPAGARLEAAYARATALADEDVETNRAIAGHGAGLLRAASKDGHVEVLTHCNAGWLATVDWGTALAPIYRAHDAGLGIHVWVDETRPRNQGASLTAWELAKHGVPHTVIADNMGGHLMQHGQVDICFVGADRVTRNGDAANKIGTYLKALAASDNNVPFYVLFPSSTLDWALADGRAIPLEERSSEEVSHVAGLLADGSLARVRIIPEESEAANVGFDVTPARLITGLVTERGVCEASEAGLRSLFSDSDSLSP